MSICTRMAPSPTGEFHIGSMRTLLYNYAFAKKSGGKFIIRIEDTDRTRLVEGAAERTLSVIKDYGLSWDDEPVFQSERLDIYKKYAIELVDKGFAYYCFCSKERLAELRDKQQKEGMPTTKYDRHCLHLSKEEIEKNLKDGVSYVIRLKMPDDEIVKFNDAILGEISIPSNDVDDQVLLKEDGFPTYHLAVVVDDHLMGVTHILRGIEWLYSTPKHVLLYKYLGWDLPIYAHLPNLKEIGSNVKLSKRTGSVSAIDFLRDGYLPEALINFLMFLGWNPGTKKEIYTLEEFVNDFSLERVQKTDLVSFDRQKLLWFNGHYIRSLSVDVLWDCLRDWSKKFDVELVSNSHDENFNKKVLSLVQERLKTLAEYNDLVSYFYNEPEIDKNLLYKFAKDESSAKEIIRSFYNIYNKIDDTEWVSANLDKISHDFLNEKNYKPKEAFMTLRVALTGREQSPPLFDVFEDLGKAKSLKRLEKFI